MARILVIDDEESLRFTFRNFLEKAGHAVKTCENYAAAVAAFHEFEPDVIFADIALSGGETGLDLLASARRWNPDCPVVMVTGQPEVETAAEAVRLGAFDYVPKPVRQAALLRLTASALRVVGLEREKKLLAAEKDRYRRNLEAIFQSVHDTIVSVGPDRRVVAANDALADLGGSSPDGVIGRSLERLADPCLGACRGLLEETLGKGSSVRERRIAYRDAGGQQRVVLASTAPLTDAEDGFLGALLILRDITRESTLEARLGERGRFGAMVGASAAMQRIYTLVESVSATDSTVLITGPSGTGKELLADAIHQHSRRASGPLIKVNCSALSDALLESELFGHVRGAFTGALKDRRGRFALADGGTIFLDEIGDISAALQVKLLRVLQEKAFERVGESRTVNVDVRVIAATHRNLKERVNQGLFREDLYYRLKVLPIDLPPLNARREDIGPLAAHFCDLFNRHFDRTVESISPAALDVLRRHHWPGNVRELRHALEHAFVVGTGKEIRVSELPQEILQNLDDGEETGRDGGESGIDRDRLVAALARSGWNKAKAARALGVSRQTVYRKIKSFAIDCDAESCNM